MDYPENKRLWKRFNLARCVAHWLAGEASEAERQFIEEWLKEAPEHWEELERIRQKAGEGKPQCPDLNDCWKEFEGRVGYRKIIRRRYAAYAAILLLPLCVALGLYVQLRDTPQKELPAVVEKIVPGETKARLIMADGRAIGLDKASDIRLQEKNGTQIRMMGDQLQYKADSLSSDSVVYNTLIVPVGGEYSIVLADGTKVWLNADSKLRYPVAFPDSIRRVELEGEGYFVVSKNAGKPFVVKVGGADVRVLGTSFDIFAYDNRFMATLVEGKVALTKNAGRVILSPDQQAEWLEKEQSFQVRKVDAINHTLWKEGIFWFSDTDLETILGQLARWYDLQVSFLQADLKKLRFSLEMKRYDNIEAVLRKIAYTKKVKFDVEGRVVRVRR